MPLAFVVVPVVTFATIIVTCVFATVFIRYLILPELEATSRRAESWPTPLRQLAGLILNGMEWIADKAVDLLTQAFHWAENQARDWFDELADYTRGFYESLTDFAEEAEAQLRWLVGERLFHPVRGIIPTLVHSTSELWDRLYHQVHGDIHILGARITNLTNRLYDASYGSITVLDHRLDELIDDLLRPVTGRIPRLRHDLNELEDRLFAPVVGAIPQIHTDINELIEGLYAPVTGSITQLRAGLATATERISATENYLAPTIAIATAAQLAAAVSVALDNEQKLRRLCRWDLEDIEGILDQVLLIPGIAIFVAATTLLVDEIAELDGPLREMLGVD